MKRFQGKHAQIDLDSCCKPEQKNNAEETLREQLRSDAIQDPQDLQVSSVKASVNKTMSLLVVILFVGELRKIPTAFHVVVLDSNSPVPEPAKTDMSTHAVTEEHSCKIPNAILRTPVSY